MKSHWSPRSIWGLADDIRGNPYSLNISDTDKFYQLGDDLMLITFGQDHTGTYTCKADNAFGHIESEPAEISLKCKFFPKI